MSDHVQRILDTCRADGHRLVIRYTQYDFDGAVVDAGHVGLEHMSLKDFFHQASTNEEHRNSNFVVDKAYQLHGDSDKYEALPGFPLLVESVTRQDVPKCRIN